VQNRFSPGRVAGKSLLCIDRARGLGVDRQESCGFWKWACQFINDSPAWLGTHWKSRATVENRELERAQISQKNNSVEGTSGPCRGGSVSADWEFVVRKKTDWKLQLMRWLWHQSGSRRWGRRIPWKLFPVLAQPRANGQPYSVRQGPYHHDNAAQRWRKFDSLDESDQKTLKVRIHSFPAWRSAF